VVGELDIRRQLPTRAGQGKHVHAKQEGERAGAGLAGLGVPARLTGNTHWPTNWMHAGPTSSSHSLRFARVIVPTLNTAGHIN
jgi:hypothetical protein